MSCNRNMFKKMTEFGPDSGGRIKVTTKNGAGFESEHCILARLMMYNISLQVIFKNVYT